MAIKPETNFIASIHKRLARTYFEKMNNPFRSGTPDVWYSGHRGDLWVEYKYLPKVPKSQNILPNLSAQQCLWLGLRFDEGRRVAVVVGSPQGAVIYHQRDWDVPMSTGEFMARAVSRDDLAAWIFNLVGAKQCSQSPTSPPPPG